MTQLVLIAVTVVAAVLSSVKAPYPNELLLQHVGTAFLLFPLAVLVVRPGISNLSFASWTAFTLVHIIGARWIYSYVPYDDAIKMLTGTTLAELFMWDRNQYDRFVHFMSGLLGIAPASELLQRLCRITPLAAAVMAVSCVTTFGAMYEIIEWQIAMTFSPERAEAYNGQQGDVWDPQKDLALAMLGGLVSAILLSRWKPTVTR